MGSNGTNGSDRRIKAHWSLSPKKRAFITALGLTGNIREAARVAKIRRENHYDWMKADPEYVEAAKSAFKEAGDILEAEARRRAVEGVAEPVFYQGQAIGAVRKYSDVLLIFLLKGVKPEKFRERHEHKHEGEVAFTLESAIARLEENAKSRL